MLWVYLIQSTNPNTPKVYVMDRLRAVSDIQNSSLNDIEYVLKQLKIGKSAGADHIFMLNPDLSHASDRLTVFLSIVCTIISIYKL